MIKYLGSKRLLVPHIMAQIGLLPNVRTVLDIFSGTARVGYAAKRAGFRVVANDHNAYAATLARCYVQSDAERMQKRAASLIEELNRLKGVDGYFTETFCVRSRFFRPENGRRVDAIREAIESKSLGPEIKSILLVSLMEAADRVDSTVGLQMAYLKQWAPRALSPLQLRVPELVGRSRFGKSRACQLDAADAASRHSGDVAYLDPPYNQHKYLGNYHIWETLALWDKPQFYGVACKRVDCRQRRSAFNSRGQFSQAFDVLLHSLDCRYVIISFSDEGCLSIGDMTDMLQGHGAVTLHSFDFRRHVGARIGIYGPSGKQVGQVSHTRNKEYLFVVERRARTRKAA